MSTLTDQRVRWPSAMLLQRHGKSFTVTLAGWLRAKAPSALRGTK
jgi:hypothetical protein